MQSLSLLAFLSLVAACSASIGAFRLLHEWKYIEYDWDSDDQKQDAIKSGDYNYSASVLVDVDLVSEQRVFVTILRVPGVPATLATVTNKTGDGGPLLKPYPDWSYNQNDDCKGLTNVYRTALDDCDQLWAVDSGMINYKSVCPAKLVVFDLKTDSVVNVIEIPSSMYNGILLTPVIHYLPGQECKNPAVYIADPYGGALVIYDGDEFCRFEAEEFEADPDANTYTVAGESFTRDIGVLGMTLAPAVKDDPDDEERPLFFRPLASYNLYMVSSGSLCNYCKTKTKPDIIKANYTMPSQAVALAISESGVLFFGYTEKTSIQCWASWKEPNDENIVTLAEDEEQFQWSSGVKICGVDKEMQYLAVLTNRYQKVVDGTISDYEVNYRIFVGEDIYMLTEATNCALEYP